MDFKARKGKLVYLVLKVYRDRRDQFKVYKVLLVFKALMELDLKVYKVWRDQFKVYKVFNLFRVFKAQQVFKVQPAF